MAATDTGNRGRRGQSALASDASLTRFGDGGSRIAMHCEATMLPSIRDSKA